MAWSVINFSGEEIVKLAVAVEQQGQKFYEIAVDKVGDPEIKEMFTALASEEKQHIIDFEALGIGLGQEFVPNESYVNEYSNYMHALIDNHVFNHDNVDKLAAGVTTVREALAVAMQFEKDSILIFQELYNVVDASGKDIIGKIIDQEKQHIRKIATGGLF
ncbi:Rubrerythrin [Sporotomaculum syntrophicum]|uniref:Rubrerythrin n=1 Tax=Sporotomaculum syntrophicum TaxID=182264 RepID=A0A9D2WRG1_9FIRM|nr:ferritin family protein [Sporotomaculum syntrophicum]KAF1085728.1 Rubrerythrin [Sporotomaculum syntrophicum]